MNDIKRRRNFPTHCDQVPALREITVESRQDIQNTATHLLCSEWVAVFAYFKP